MRFCRTARQEGIDVSLYMLIGVPTETPADARKTTAVARACMPHEIFPSIYYPYPGTELHKLSAQMRLIDAAALGTKAERSRVYVRLNGYPRWRVFLDYIMMPWRVFYGRRDTFRLFRGMLFRILCIVPGVLTLIVHMQHAARRLRALLIASPHVPTTAA
jgi:radical SAM superfamily enzyme YgiQ (UPF0313 family)